MIPASADTAQEGRINDQFPKRINIQTIATNPTMAWTPVNAVTDCNQHTVIADNSSTHGDVDIYYRNPSKGKFDFRKCSS